jgi:stearoyl-CoA desaturase (Delta-9 desaturase)
MFKFLQSGKGMLLTASIVIPLMILTNNVHGVFGIYLDSSPWLILSIYAAAIAHITITAMSLSFHRYHTHKGVIFNKVLDHIFQIILWVITSTAKSDWVSVHMYHHANSDKEKDPHSPIQRGFWHVFFKGVLDYNTAKSDPNVIKIRERISNNKIESFIYEYNMLGPYFLTLFMIILFGVQYGVIISILNYIVSPLFAIGGVNALAHWWGYKNHKSGDNSRNIGFLFPINFLVCGELDHNNHHGHQKSCSFRHKWYEFDIGYAYIKIFEFFKLAEIKNAYTPLEMRKDLSRQVAKLLNSEANIALKNKCYALAKEFDITVHELTEKISKFIEGEKIKLEKPMIQLKNEILFHLQQSKYQFSI